MQAVVQESVCVQGVLLPVAVKETPVQGAVGVCAVRGSAGRAALVLAAQPCERGPAAYGPGVLHVQWAVEGRGQLAAAPGASRGRGSAESGGGGGGHDMGRGDGTL